ncbi:MAG: flagellar basal body rod protein FlgB [Deltaproteobacteria bacterium]|nr:flagellar basal body rod protein FlgB [Deltaproteobacteria bacterium]
MTINQLFDSTSQLLVKAAQLQRRKAEVIAGNIANLDTPGYKAKDFRFESELRRASGSTAADQPLELTRTRTGHLPLSGSSDGDIGETVIQKNDLGGLDGNTVNLDREMAEQAINNAAYVRTMQLLKTKMAILKTAIIEGGK